MQQTNTTHDWRGAGCWESPADFLKAVHFSAARRMKETILSEMSTTNNLNAADRIREAACHEKAVRLWENKAGDKPALFKTGSGTNASEKRFEGEESGVLAHFLNSGCPGEVTLLWFAFSENAGVINLR